MRGRTASVAIYSSSRPDGGAPRDLTPGADYDVPPFSLDGAEAIAFSPDSQELCFTANTDKDEATSTNGDLFTVPVSGASAAEAHHDESRRRLGPGSIRPTENGSRTARSFSRDTKAIAGG